MFYSHNFLHKFTRETENINKLSYICRIIQNFQVNWKKIEYYLQFLCTNAGCEIFEVHLVLIFFMAKRFYLEAKVLLYMPWANIFL